MSTDLNDAIKALSLHDVYLQNLKCSGIESLVQKYTIKFDSMHVFQFHKINDAAVFEVDGIGKIFTIGMSFGIRLTSPEDKKEQIAEIIGDFVVQYLIQGDLSQEVLEEFAFKEANKNAWPSWRETLEYNLIKMRLPKVTLPPLPFEPYNIDSKESLIE